MSIAHTYSMQNRQKKWQLFNAAVLFDAATKILDVGFTDTEYSESDNFLEKHYPYPSNITALGVEEPIHFTKKYPKVPVVLYDGNAFPFADKSFHVGWSNAVLEHVGTEQEQVLFLQEMHRVCHKVFITTPNRYFPFEVHTRLPFVHWLPKKASDFFFTLFGKSWATGEYMRLLSERDVRRLLQKAGIEEYRLVKNTLFGFTVDFVVIF